MRNYYSLINSMGSGASAIDSDAQAFITAAAITDSIQQTAINTLVTDLKTYNIWTKMKAIYPFVGGTASTHKWNLKDPRDLDAAFRLTFSGGGTHDSNGYVMNGTDSFADTKFNASAISGWKDSHTMGVYIGTQTPYGTGWHIGIGDTNTADPLYGLAVRRSLSPFTDYVIYDSGNFSQSGRTSSTQTDARGFWTGRAFSVNQRELFKNTNIISSNYINAVVGTVPNNTFYIGAMRGVNGSANLYLSGVNKLTYFADVLTNTELTNLYTSVQAYQTILSRNN